MDSFEFNKIIAAILITILVIIGIGINVRQKKRSGREGLLLVEDLFQDGMEVDRNKVIAAIIKHIDSVIDVFEKKGFIINWKALEKPTRARRAEFSAVANNVVDQSETAEVEHDYLDVPAFLRRQAD